jgi:drug/metabolite transporter (DMT)-like permease
VGRDEGIRFSRDRWIGYLAAGTLFGAASTLYDKHLLGTLQYRPATVQAWFAIYLVVLFAPLAAGWKRRWWPRGEFQWRWSIPGIGLALLVSDFLYFSALHDPDGLVSVVTAIRRTSVVVSFVGGLLWFGERNGLRKAPVIAGILGGVLLIVLG